MNLFIFTGSDVIVQEVAPGTYEETKVKY